MPVKTSHLAAWLIGQDFTTTTVSKSNNQITDQLADRYLLRLLPQAFGFLSSILFVVDMVLNYRVFQIQRAQEIPPEQAMQGPPQRRVWDINYQYTGVFRQIGRNGKTSLYSSLWNVPISYFLFS